MSTEKRVYLKRDREKPVLHLHPWIFSGAIKRVEGIPEAGETVIICTAEGEFLARAAYSPESQIRARIWSWDQTQEVNSDFIRARINSALKYRDQIGYTSPLRRLIHAESDRLPGLVADQYGDVVVLQVLSAGIEIWKNEIIEILADLTGIQTIYERSDVKVRKLEGLDQHAGLLYGQEPDELVEVEMDGLSYWVDIRKGHKTGTYLDQKDNRQIIGKLCSGLSVLDCFSYSGGFSMHALKHNADSVTLIDESEEALQLAEKHILSNGLPGENMSLKQGNVFEVLRKFRDQAKSFDVVILDPPKFAPTASYKDKAARGYKDINLLALKLLKPGGLLATFSCSGGISREFFLRILSGAALDAGVNARIQLHLGQSADHSVNLSFPEGIYLKGYGIRVD
ncbi:MAG: class I SAM-dependent rRNA methyltransferase [Chloroflexi bacterium]|nr:class I SAM-dependent rRNA methyltransferase [Chloroflexota bacterium]